MESHDARFDDQSMPIDSLISRQSGVESVGDDCYVRALYPFASSEPSSLEFKPGDFIRVLTKLESGWWDGLLRGKRGWFPSNYVEEVEIVSSDEDDDKQVEKINEGEEQSAVLTRSQLLGDSVSQSTASIQESSRPDLYTHDSSTLHSATQATKPGTKDGGAFWIPQTSSEGHIYFFNTMTGKSSWEIPFQSMTDAESRPKAPFTTPITTGFRPPVEPHPLAVPSPNMAKLASERFPTSTPSPGINGMHAASSTLGWTDANGEDILAVDSPDGVDEDGEILLFASPVPRAAVVPDLTNAKMPINEEDRRLQATLPTLSKESSDANDISDLLLPHSQKFSITLEALKRSVAVQDAARYRILSSDLKATTCEVFSTLNLAQYSLDSADGQAQTSTEVWRTMYERILRAITTLMVSSQHAGSDFGVQDDAAKMLVDAEALHALVLAFITGVISQTIVLPNGTASPSYVSNAMATRPFMGDRQGSTLTRQRSNTSNTSVALVQLSSEAVAEVESFKALIQTGVKTCKAKLKRSDQGFSAATGSTVLRDAIDVLAKVRQMLAYCEQVDLSPLDPPAGSELPRSPTIADFTKSKQMMYDASASLILAAQGVTNLATTSTDSSQPEPVAGLIAAFATLETSISSVVLNFEFMVQEYVAKYGQYDTNQHETEIILGTDSMRRRGVSTRSLGDDHSIDSPVILSASTFSTPATSTRSTFPQYPTHGDVPWFLEPELESELSYDSKGNVRAGTLVALIERLTRHDNLDSVFNNTFLLTYRSFTTAEELSSLLMKRFLIEPPQGLTSAQHDIWVDLKQRPVQLRVYNIFKSWMENFFVEPPNEATHEWLAQLKQFVRSSMAEHIANAPILVKLIEKRIVQGDVPFRKMVLNTTSQAPVPIVPRNLKKIRLLDLDALEVARQLTIMESNLYNKIKPTECLDKSWSKPDAAEGAENIKAMILHSNQITAWVAEAILYQTDLKKRVNLIKHFVMIAEKCRQLHNFSALTAIISGLNSAPIHRLRRTWDLLPARAAVSAEDLNRLMNSSKNFSSYRDALHQTQPPCVPFLGVYLTDLTFIEDGNPNMSIKARHLINISKRQKTADVIREIQQYQAVPYCLQPVPEIQSYIRSCMDITRDISELYNISLEREPREREDEKIARLLQESGFL